MSSKKKTKKQEEKKTLVIEEEPLNEWGIRNSNLYLHQKNNVMKMEYQESTKEREYTIGNRKVRIYSNMGILNDKVGSGKTLTVVSLLSRDKLKPHEDDFNYPWTIDMGSNHYFSYVTEETLSFESLKLNIIVCSSSIFQQWDKELKKTDLTYKVITKNADITDIEIDLIKSLDVMVITYNRYRDFCSRFNRLFNLRNIGIKRIIFDELQLTGVLPMAKAEFYWIISATLPYDGYNFTYRSIDNKIGRAHV
jgi:hypothetical protein